MRDGELADAQRESAAIEEMEALSDELMSLVDGPHTPETERRVAQIAAETEARIAELDLARVRARQREGARQRRTMKMRLGMYALMLMGIVLYFALGR